MNHANRNVRTAIKSVDEVYERRRETVILRDGDREQIYFFTALERMNDGQRQSVVDVIADIRVEDKAHGLLRCRGGSL